MNPGFSFGGLIRIVIRVAPAEMARVINYKLPPPTSHLSISLRNAIKLTTMDADERVDGDDRRFPEDGGASSAPSFDAETAIAAEEEEKSKGGEDEGGQAPPAPPEEDSLVPTRRAAENKKDSGQEEQREALQPPQHQQPHLPTSSSTASQPVRSPLPPPYASSSIFSQQVPPSSSASSQHGPPSQTQTTEILTQSGADWSQLGDDDDDDDDCEGDDGPPNSQAPPFSPVPVLPWGRLLPVGGEPPLPTEALASKQHPSSSTLRGKPPPPPPPVLLRPVDLLPRPNPEALMTSLFSSTVTAASTSATAVTPRPGDPFNEYVLGRSEKCDVQIEKPLPPPPAATSGPTTNNTKKATVDRGKLLEWAHGMVSNRHARIYCVQQPHTGLVDVYVEDTSNNGTLVNGTHLLQRHQRRLLHSGDEICLLNPQTLSKKVRSTSALRSILQQYSFVFVRLAAHHHHTPHILPMNPPHPHHHPCDDHHPEFPIPRSHHHPKPAVDPRAVRHPSEQPQPPPPPQWTSVAADATGAKHGTSVAALPQPVIPARQVPSRISPRRDPQQQPVRRIELDYDLREILGKGTVGEVRRAIERRTGIPRAVKVVPLPKHPHHPHAAEATTAASTLLAEAQVLRTLDHPYIVKLLDVYSSPQALYLVMEYLPGGDLFDRVSDRGQYNEVQARRALRRLLAALHYLHVTRNVVHRDLKPENVLLVSRDNDFDLKIADFGLAKALASSTPSATSVSPAGPPRTSRGALKTFCGTPLYFAPEILQRRTTVFGRGRYDHKADLWSVGVTLYVLLSGTQPFADQDWTCAGTTGLTSLDFAAPHWDGVSEQATDLVRGLLQPDPRRRLSVTEACEHPWILQDDGDTHTHPLDDPRLAGVAGFEERRLGRRVDGEQVDSPPEDPSALLDKAPRSGGGAPGPAAAASTTTTSASLPPGPNATSSSPPSRPLETRMEPNDDNDDVLSRFSENTESISSFGTSESTIAMGAVASSAEAERLSAVAAPPSLAEKENVLSGTKKRKPRRITDSMGRLGGTPSPSKRATRKAGNGTNPSHGNKGRNTMKARSEDAKDGSALQKQTTLSNWFKQK